MSGRKTTPIPATRYAASTAPDRPAILRRNAAAPSLHLPPPTRFGAAVQTKSAPPTCHHPAPPPTRFSSSHHGSAAIQRAEDRDWRYYQNLEKEKKQKEKESKWKQNSDKEKLKEEIKLMKSRKITDVNRRELCAVYTLATLSGKSREDAFILLQDVAAALSTTTLLEYCDDQVIDVAIPKYGNCEILSVPDDTTIGTFMGTKKDGVYALSIVITSDISHIFVVKKAKTTVTVITDSEEKSYASYEGKTIHAAFKKK